MNITETRDATDFWDTPLGINIAGAQDRGVNVYPWGINSLGTHALIVGPNEITIARVVSVDTFGLFYARRETWDESETLKASAAADYPRIV